jgi:hypothetical protein
VKEHEYQVENVRGEGECEYQSENVSERERARVSGRECEGE